MGRRKQIVYENNTENTVTKIDELKKSKSNSPVLRCLCCGKELDDTEKSYKNNSIIYKKIGRLPYCQDCIVDIYESYVDDYKKQKCANPYSKAMQRFCMAFDYYYSDKVFEAASRELSLRDGFGDNDDDYSLVLFYLRQMNLVQYRKKNYNSTLKEELDKTKKEIQEEKQSSINDDDVKRLNTISKATSFFGTGFTSDDYVFLQEQYDDWVTRHECQTKSQEEMFKQICFTQLNLLKAQRLGEDTKDINATYLKQLEAAKLQPKQNKGEAVSENQTFGTLIEKWEQTRPIPEPEEDLKDVDKLGLMLDVFFKGHLAKAMRLKNGLSNLYDRYMKKYTVNKPEYKDDEDNEVLFDAIFGSSALMDEE